MKTIYTRPVCPACHVLKAKLTKEGVPFEAITVIDEGEPKPPGRWIERKDFVALYPDVRAFPFVVENRKPEMQPNGVVHMVDQFTRKHYDTRTGAPLFVVED